VQGRDDRLSSSAEGAPCGGAARCRLVAKDAAAGCRGGTRYGCNGTGVRGGWSVTARARPLLVAAQSTVPHSPRWGWQGRASGCVGWDAVAIVMVSRGARAPLPRFDFARSDPSLGRRRALLVAVVPCGRTSSKGTETTGEARASSYTASMEHVQRDACVGGSLFLPAIQVHGQLDERCTWLSLRHLSVPATCARAPLPLDIVHVSRHVPKNPTRTEAI